MRGRVRDAIPVGDKTILSLEIDVTADMVNEYIGQELDVDIERHRARRSLSANAYFHVLCDKLRQRLGLSMPECKNHLIASYGQVLYMEDGKQAIIKTNVEPGRMAQSEAIHTALVKIDDDGVYFYRLYRGSHNYNSKEMALLIDGTIEECKAQGIETVSKADRDRMIEAWRKTHG